MQPFEIESLFTQVYAALFLVIRHIENAPQDFRHLSISTDPVNFKKSASDINFVELFSSVMEYSESDALSDIALRLSHNVARQTRRGTATHLFVNSQEMKTEILKNSRIQAEVYVSNLIPENELLATYWKAMSGSGCPCAIDGGIVYDSDKYALQTNYQRYFLKAVLARKENAVHPE